MKKQFLKRVLSTLLVGTMVAGLLAGCGNEDKPSENSTQQSEPDKESEAPDPGEDNQGGDEGHGDEWIADRDIVVQIFVSDAGNALPEDQENTPIFQEIKKRTGISLKLQYTPGQNGSLDALTTQLNAGLDDSVDAMICYLNNSTRPEFPVLLKAAKTDEMFADVSEYMKNSKVYSKYYEDGYLPKDSYKNIVFREDLDGVYLLHLNVDEVDRSMIYDPNEEYLGGPYIQKRIVDELQIDPKSIRTPEEFYDLLVKIKEHGFKDDNGQDIIPLGPKFWGGSFDALDWDMRGLRWGISDGYNMDKDGKIYHEAETDYIYDLINYVRKLMAEGLMDREYFDKSEERAGEGAWSKSYGIIGDVHNYVDIIYSSEDWVPLGPLNDIEGDNKMVTTGKTGSCCLAIMEQAENPEEVFRFFDWLCTYEGQLLCQYGIEGLSYNMVDGQPRVTDEVKAKLNEGDEEWLVNNVGAAFGGSGAYFFECILTNKNNIDNFGESRPGASGGDDSENIFARSVQIAKDYPREYKLKEGMKATAYLTTLDEAAQAPLKEAHDAWKEVLQQAIHADEGEVESIINAYRDRLQRAGVEEFKAKLMEIYNEDPTSIMFYGTMPE